MELSSCKLGENSVCCSQFTAVVIYGAESHLSGADCLQFANIAVARIAIFFADSVRYLYTPSPFCLRSFCRSLPRHACCTPLSSVPLYPRIDEDSFYSLTHQLGLGCRMHRF